MIIVILINSIFYYFSLAEYLNQQKKMKDNIVVCEEN